MRRDRRGFTLLELLVVISIIVILASLSLPAISKFLDGQALAQSGRVVQTAFNEARQAAITQRRSNFLVFFRKPDPEKPNEYLYGIRRFSQDKGYEGPEHLLLRGTQFAMAAGSAGVNNRVAFSLEGELPLPVFEGGVPPATDTAVFDYVADDDVVPKLDGTGLGGTLKWVEFKKDGRLDPRGWSFSDNAAMVGGNDIFDPAIEIDGAEQADFDALGANCSMNLQESGLPAVDERCFIHVQWNTGRVRTRFLTVKLPSP